MVKTDIKVVKGIRFEVDLASISPNMIYYNNSSDNFGFTDGVGNSSPIPAHTHASSKEGGQVQLTALDGYEKIFKGICTNAHFQGITETAFDNNELVCTDLFNVSGGKMSTVSSTDNVSWVTDHYQITSIDNTGTISGSNIDNPSNAFDSNDSTWADRVFDTTDAGVQTSYVQKLFTALKYIETVDIYAYAYNDTTFSSVLKEGHIKIYTNDGSSWNEIETLGSYSETTNQSINTTYNDSYTLDNPYIYGIRIEVQVLSTNEGDDIVNVTSSDFNTQISLGTITLNLPLNSRGLGKFLYNYSSVNIPTDTTIYYYEDSGAPRQNNIEINTISSADRPATTTYDITYILKSTSSSNNPLIYGYSFLTIREDS